MNIKILSDKKQSVAFWIIVWFVQSLLMSGGSGLDFYLVKNVVIVGLQFLVVYVNLKWLFPLFFEKKKYVVYIVLSSALIYSVFSVFFPLLDIVFNLYYSNFLSQKTTVFSFDFWSILSGSSFYSLALVCSTVYKLLKTNQEKDVINKVLKERLYTESKNDSITIREGHKTHMVLANDVYFVKGLKEYVVWHTEKKNIIALQTMNGIELDYKHLGFLRVHRSFIVNRNHIKSFKSNSLNINNETIPIGRAYKKDVMVFLQNKKAAQI